MPLQHKFDWRFPILDGGKRQGINDSGIVTFAGSEVYNNLAREICQNSLDAKDPKSNQPVIVSFNLKQLYKNNFYPIVGLEKALNSCKDYWSSFNDQKLNSFLKEGFSTLSNDNINVLVISDFNTIGLSGSRTRTGAWDALTGSNGVSFKTSGSQGSFGIGKNAPYACSSLRTVFYNTYSKEDNEFAFQGVTLLVTHRNDVGKETQGCGFYYNIEDKKPIFKEDNCNDIQIFNRDKYGTDIIILGFKKNDNWKNDIKYAIVKNFFIAILDSKLIVKIDDVEINNNSIKKIISDGLQIDKKDDELQRIKNYCETYSNSDKVFESKLIQDNDVKLYIKVDDFFSRSVSFFRASGMLIYEKKYKKMKPYEAVLIVNGSKANDLLKLMEPPKHDKWDSSLLDDEKINSGKKLKNALNKFVADSIESMCKIETADEIDPDGISSFLPDDIDFINKKGKDEKTNYPKETIVIANVKKTEVKISIENKMGSLNSGENNNGDVHNDTTSGVKTDNGYPTSGDEKGEEEVVTMNNDGTKTINQSSKYKARLIPITIDKGLYKIVINFECDYSLVEFNFKVLGEDGNQEVIRINGFNIDGSFKKCETDSLQLKNVIKNKTYNVIIALDVYSRVVITIGGVGNEA